MASVKISELTALTAPAAADELAVVDVSANSTKKATVGEVVGIINGDVEVSNDGTATISELPVGKLQDGAARQVLQTDAAGTGVEWTSNVDIPGTLDVTSTATFDSIAQHPLGTAGAPTVTFTGDTNTGIYSPGADQVAISTNGTGRLFVDASGNVGIGTTSPVATAHLSTTAQYSAINGNATAGLFISQTGGTPADGAYGTAICLSKINSTRPGGAIASVQTSADDDQLGLAFLVHSSSTTNNTLIEALRISHAGTATFTASASTAPFIANIGASEAARIDSSGRLLVGTSTSVSQFGVQPQIQSTGISGAGGYLGLTVFNTAADSASNLVLGHSKGGSVGTYTASVANDLLGEVTFTAANGTDMRRGASISALADADWGTNDHPARLVFFTTADGASSPTERFRITNDGVIAHDKPAPAAVNATATLTIANLKAGIITSTSAAATDMTLPTGTDTQAGFSGTYDNFTFEWSVINTGPSLVRVLAGTAHTIVGSGSVATGTSGRFASRRTAANTFVTYRLS